MSTENQRERRQRQAAERQAEIKKEKIRFYAIIIGIIVAGAVLIASIVGISHWQAQKAAQEDAAATTIDATNGTLDTTEGTVVELGDTVAIDYVGTQDGVAFDGGTGSYDLTLGSGSFIAGFEDGLVGHAVGETVELNLTFPEDYRNAEMAGAEVVFTVTINGVYR